MSGLGPDAGNGACSFPDEGCPCDAGTAPVECFPEQPVMHDGQLLCQHGTRVCRDSLWTACENITYYAPTTSDKILNAPGRVSQCQPDSFTQSSTPDATDITTTTGTGVSYSNGTPPGVVLTTLPPGTNPLTIDGDGDGVPDIVDDCPMDNQHWRSPCTGPMSAQGFFHILPPGSSANDPMSVDLQVKTVDTYLLIDTTASMGGEIANLRTGLSSLMGSIQTTIPGAGFGLGMYRETPVAADSQNNDFPFMHLLDPTTSLSVAQSITNQVLDTEGNSFWPEAGAQALYAVASGNGIGPWVGKRTCSNGGFGWPCFRSGTVPVVIVVTDAPFWNGPSYYTSVAGRNRPELSHNPYPGTSGTTTIGSRNIPQATTVSSTGQIMISNDTAATAFLIGDMTDRSLTVHGANNGATTRLTNDFTEVCGGRTPSGPDVFYTFTIDTPRHFIFEAFADFDPTLYLRRVSSGVASTVGCNLDSASVADGNGNLVWRTGAKIDTRTIPGVGATTTNASLTGCSASSSSVPTPMTGCSIATQTTSATLSGCTVPSTTYTSNLSGCTVDNTPSVSNFTGCTVPSTTDGTVTGCSFENVTTAATLTGCTIPSTATTSRFTGCQIATPTSTTLNSCAFPTSTTTVNLSGCINTGSSYTNIYNGTCTRQWGQTTTLSGCSFPNVTTNGSYTGCTLVATVQLTGCRTNSGSATISSCDAFGVEVGTPVTGTGIPAGTTIASISYTSGGNPRIVMSQNATASNSGITVTNDVTNYLTNCTGSTVPQVGMTVSGNSSVVGTGRTISAYSGSNPYAFTLSTPPAGSNGDCGGSGSGACSGRTLTATITAQNLNQMTGCTVSSGSAPTSGARVVGTGWTAGTTLSSVSGSGPYTVNFTAPANSTSSTLTGLQTQSNTVWENCNLYSGNPPAVGMVLDIYNGPSGTTTITAVSGSDPYTITTSQAITSSSADIQGADSYNEFHGTGSGEWCRSFGATHPVVGMTVAGTNIPAGTTISSVSYLGSRACAGSNGTSNTYCQNGCSFNADGTCSGCTYTSSCNGASSRWFYWTDIDLSNSATASGSGSSITSASSTTTDLTQVTGCTIPGGSTVPMVGWTLGGTGLNAGATIASISGSSPYTIGLSAGAAMNASSTVTSATAATNLSQFVNCTLMAGDPAPVSGMVVTGTNLGAGTTTINGTPTLSAGKYTIPITPNAANATATMSQAAATTYTTNRVTGCTRSSGTLQNGQTVTGTNLPASPVVANLSGSGTGPYSFDFGTVGSSTTLPTYTVTGASVTTTDLTHMINCAVTGIVPMSGDSLVGTGLTAGATVASTTGSGPYRINFSAGAAMSASSTLSGLSRNTPQLNKLTNCVLAAGNPTPVAGMDLAGTSLIPSGAPLPTIVGAPTLSAGKYTITMSQNASAAGAIAAVTGTSNVYNYSRLINCTVTGDALQSGMSLTATNVAAGTTISNLTALAGGKWAFNISNPSSAVNPMATSAAITINDLLHLTGCSLSSGSLVNGMPLSGTRLAAGTIMSSYTGTGPYTLTLDRNALSAGATTATGSLTVPLPQLTGCQGNFLLLNMIGVTGTGIQADTTITSFTGLGTAANPWTIDLSLTPITTGTNITANALMPGLGNQLTGCMLVSGTGPLVDATGVPPGMAMSGPLVAGGSTLSLATGSGAGPYTLTLSDPLIGIAECSGGGGACTTDADCVPPTGTGGTCTVTTTTASGTITTGASGGASPLAPGTYQLVVDSGTQNAASASSPGRGTFQLRMTNLTNPPSATDATQSMDVPWATTSAALNAAGIKTIGIASCPAACLDLSTRQSAYATCVQGASPTNTTGADNTSLTNTYCGAGYNRCIALFGAAQAANCSTIFNECRSAEISAGQQNVNVRTSACNAIQTGCNRVFAASGTNCTSVYNYCRGSSGSPASPATSAVCTSQASSVTTCLTSTSTSLTDAGQYCDETLFDLGAMGTATNSVRADGTPFVYQIAEDGSGLSTTIADGVRELAQYILFDVTAGCEPVGSVACTGLFANAVVPRAGATSPVGQTPGCQTCSGASCTRCTPGAQLPYQVNFNNAPGTGVAQTNVTQIFDFYIVLRDATGAELSRAPVRIVVPPVSPTLVEATGSYTQLYDGSLDTSNNVGCPYPGRRADWGNFVYTSSLPAGTSIAFQFRTGDTLAEVNAASPVSVAATSTPNSSVDVGALLVAAGQSNYHRYVRMTAVLSSDTTQTLTPVLQTYTMNYTCVDAE